MDERHAFTLKEIKQETPDIKSFIFDLPQQGFSWQAGQYLDWQLPHHNADDRGERRWFSISSAPSEGVVMLSCRFSEESSSLKKHLLTLKPGDTVEADGPMGEFIAESNDKPLILVAGGIGITPFRSILLERAHAGTLQNITLIYGNKSAENIAFKDELDALAAQNPGFTIHYVNGQHITAELIEDLLGDLEAKSYMISGLEKMVAAIEESLVQSGVPKNMVRIDDFGGYDWNVQTAVYQ